MAETSTKLGRVSIVPQGVYDPTTEYHWLDIVQYDGSSFLVLKENITGVTPVDGADYMMVAERGEKGTKGDPGDKGNAITVTGGGMVELAASLGLGPGPYKFIFTKAEE